MTAAHVGVESEIVAGRRRVLETLGATPEVVAELLRYNENVFAKAADATIPEGDEPHVEIWREYVAAAGGEGTIETLSRHLVQLSFPVREGMSATDVYRAATRRGEWPEQRHGPSFVDSGSISLEIHPTPAGAVPIITAGNRADFDTLVRVLSARNEPVPVPASMGACIVTGFNNWDRIRRLREAWRDDNQDATDEDWSAEFRRITPRKELYQDRFIILSSGNYSDVGAGETPWDEDRWRVISLAIRKEHEATHYFTYRVLGAMRNNLIDEIMADYAGLVGALGRYDEALALRFMGLEDYPRYRDGGRLENYPGNPPLSRAAVPLLRDLVHRAARNLAAFDRRLPEERSAELMSRAILAIAALTMEQLAEPGAPDVLSKTIERG